MNYVDPPEVLDHTWTIGSVNSAAAKEKHAGGGPVE